tara:strand:+ start:303 stop:941 length:639 start_codon:yes stop_codon:yes gene_type:complete
MFNQDIIQSIKVTGLFFLQSYKMITGTMLSIFIPQKCEIVINNTTQSNVCTLSENVNNDQPYHQLTFYWNCITLVLFIGYYIIELKREKWCIKYLDIDNNKPDNALKSTIQLYTSLDSKMDRLNKWYYNILIITMIFYSINIILMIKVINDNYHSSSTLSSFISFVLLVLMKLYNSYIVANQSVKNDKMMSAYMSEFVSFNILDKDYLAIRP